MCKYQTVLRRLCAVKQTENCVKDELNLYYVAMTRAKHTLHMLFEEKVPTSDVQYAKSFAEFTDFSAWKEYWVTEGVENELVRAERQPIVFHPDEELAQDIMQAFSWEYAHIGFENLPVKSSATQLMTAYAAEETPNVTFGAVNVPTTLFDENEGTDLGADGVQGGISVDDKELGIAYHAFLENFDFSLLCDENGVPMSALNVETAIQEELKKQ
jgi:ATP-dependent exoDNAse (exonuclease V) beta subunit